MAIQYVPGGSPNWTLALLRGIAGIVFGIIAIGWPGPALQSLVLLFSAYMLVDGVLALGASVQAARNNESWAWIALGGVVDLIAAAVAFFMPGVTVLVLVTLLGAWSVVAGVFLLIAAARMRGRQGRPWMILSGVLSVIWGAALFVWPITGALVMVLWLGAYALVFGVILLVFAFRVRHEQRMTLNQRAA